MGINKIILSSIMGKDDYKAVDGEALEEPDLLSR